MRSAPLSTDPLAWEIKPGLRVGDVSTAEQCEEMARLLDMEREVIMAQIARQEEDLSSRPAGWRSKAQAAMRWKGRIKGALRDRAAKLRTGTPNRDERRRKALLGVIYDEVGEEEFARFAALAEARHPELFTGGDHGG